MFGPPRGDGARRTNPFRCQRTGAGDARDPLHCRPRPGPSGGVWLLGARRWRTRSVLSSAQMQKVMHNDRVRARLVGYDRRGRPEGQIVEVIERAHTHLSGRLILKEEGMWLAPSDQRISQEILIQPRGRR